MKKKWYKRWWAIVLYIIIGLIIIGLFLPESKTTEQISKQTKNIPKETYKLDLPIQNEPSKEKIYSINQDINVDYLIYKITKVETFTKMGTSVFEKKTNGKFIKVYLTILNNAKETKEIFSPRFILIDSQERQFDSDIEAILYITDSITFGEQLQPGLPLEGAIVFEVPKDANNFKLKIKGDWLSISEVFVKLDNIKDIGYDRTKEEELNDLMGDWEEQAQEQMEDLMKDFNL